MTEASPPIGALSAAPDPWAGKMLGKYRISHRLGKGGMGLVYEAADTVLKRHVAIKVLPEALSEQPDALARFLLEARAAGRLNHPNVVAIYDVDKDQATSYIVMELVDGGSAQEFLNTRGPFDWPEATQIIAAACRGLIAAHGAGLIHRDIKPSNIMRSGEGIVKLADFGLAKVTSSQSSVVPVTATGYTVGTPDYMSPEQCRAEDLDQRSDLYSLGATYYCLLTGKPPYRGTGPLQVMFAHCSNAIPDPRTINPHVPERVNDVIQRAMAKFPAERYGSAAALLGDLEAVLALVPRQAVVPATQWTNIQLEPLEQTPATAPVPLSAEASAVLAPAEQPGELGRLGPYRVLKMLGEGGMGMVFQAEDPTLERLVALKVMKTEKTGNDLARQRFLLEAKAAAKVQHEHIVTIFQVGEDRGTPYLAMQYLHGESLEDRLHRERILPTPEVVRIGREMAAGLGAAHDQGLIHRDIKPANVWLEDPRGRVKILDFGLARSLSGTGQNLTRTGLVMGTPGYMAPEQARGMQTIDHRCDLFSLGCVLYHLCTGQEPFRRDDVMATLLALALEDPPPISDLNPAVPAALVELVMTLLAKAPTDRPASAHAVIDSLVALERAPQTAAVSPLMTAVVAGAATAQDRLAAHGLAPSESVTNPMLPPATTPTPPGGQPRTTLVEALVTKGRRPSCPRCGAAMEGSSPTNWCLACGYQPGEAKKEPEPETQESIGLRWLYVLLGGSLVVVLGSLAAAHFMVRDTMPRIYFSTGEVVVGLMAVMAGHLWAFFVVLPERQDHEVFHYIDPFKLWGYTFKLLPQTQKPLWMGTWGGVAMLCAALIVGGLDYWWVPPKRHAPPPGQAGQREEYDPVETAATKEPEMPAADDPTLADEQKRFTTQCQVIGYSLDEKSGGVASLALATQRQGKWLFAGQLTLEAGDLAPDEEKQVRDPKKRRTGKKGPIVEGLKLPGDWSWVEPGVTLPISYIEMDEDGVLVNPRIAKPENSPGKSGKNEEPPKKEKS